MSLRRLTPRHHQAARLLAEDLFTDADIAKQVGVRRRTILRWKKLANFQELVTQYRQELDEQILQQGVARRAARIRRYNDRLRRMDKVIEQRAEAPEMAGVPGGDTGLLVRTFKSVGVGENNQLISEYAVDVGLLREMRELEKQAAQDLGQWTEKADLTSGGVPFEFTINIDRLDGPDDRDGS